VLLPSSESKSSPSFPVTGQSRHCRVGAATPPPTPPVVSTVLRPALFPSRRAGKPRYPPSFYATPPLLPWSRPTRRSSATRPAAPPPPQPRQHAAECSAAGHAANVARPFGLLPGTSAQPSFFWPGRPRLSKPAWASPDSARQPFLLFSIPFYLNRL
jgi:hypothetical protein